MSIVKNYLYNMSYQILVLILPLITMPYISRTLGTEMVGEYAFTFSIAQYFVLVATVGITMYGCRAISYTRNDKRSMSNTFWSIFTTKCLTSLLSIVIYVIFVCIFIKENKLIYWIQGLNILAVLVDISWFFNGLEKLKNIVVRNLVVKVLSIGLIFLFVKESNDIYVYTLILGLSLVVGQLIMWREIYKYVEPLRKSEITVVEHIRPIFKLFIPQIAIQIYVVLDKTMLGIFTTNDQVAYYEMAIRIVKMSLAVVTSLGMVMMPRIANEFSNGNLSIIKKYISNSLKFVCLISIPMAFGMIGVSTNFISWFLGPEFYYSGIIMSIISPIVIFMAISNVIGVQCMIPMGREKAFTKSVVIAAITNFIINLVFIPKYGFYAAAISTVIAEAIVAIIQFRVMRNFIDLKMISGDICKSFIASFLMLLILKGLIYMRINLVFVIGIGILVYFTILVILKCEILMSFINSCSFQKLKMNKSKRVNENKYKGEI